MINQNSNKKPARWAPYFGANVEDNGTVFRVWAPKAGKVELLLAQTGKSEIHTLNKLPNGIFEIFLPGMGNGALYRYRVDGQGPYPDPASRFQPQGVHGPSQVIDPKLFTWNCLRWKNLRPEELVIYELHIGAFTAGGAFKSAVERLPYLLDLGISAIEIMPVADFPGNRNWGYDGVCLYAPAGCYGTPDDFRRLIDAAHSLGLNVILDVVYNHLGPDGNYLSAFSPYYFTGRHKTPWGPAINYDGPNNEMVKLFFTDNALHWIYEYNLDGLRLDATHAIIDESSRHILKELNEKIHSHVTDRKLRIIAEDNRNLAHIVQPAENGGWGLDAVWADDFHHEVRRHLAGDHEGYYQDYSGAIADIATTIQQGWFFCGQYSQHSGGPRGTNPDGLHPCQFVICLENHDQVGNRAFGERLNHQIELSAYRAATALLLCAPQTPLIFMGQEWGAGTPFLYFTDHHSKLGDLITKGRREEFKDFSLFSDPKTRTKIPDPQAHETFLSSKLRWDENGREPHQSLLRLYKDLLKWRKTEAPFKAAATFKAQALSEKTLLLRWDGIENECMFVIAQLKGSGQIKTRPPLSNYKLLLTTEDKLYASKPKPPHIELSPSGLTVDFLCPAAVILKASLYFLSLSFLAQQIQEFVIC